MLLKDNKGGKLLGVADLFEECASRLYGMAEDGFKYGDPERAEIWLELAHAATEAEDLVRRVRSSYEPSSLSEGQSNHGLNVVTSSDTPPRVVAFLVPKPQEAPESELSKAVRDPWCRCEVCRPTEPQGRVVTIGDWLRSRGRA